MDEAAVASNVLDRTVPALLTPLDYGRVAPPGFLLAARLALFGTSEYSLRLTRTLMMRRVDWNRLRIRFSRKCYPCLRNELLPMSPEWTGLLAERVGFVPDEAAPLNDLRAIATARIRQIR